MRAPQRFFPVLLSAVLYAGCGGSDPVAPEVADMETFVGTWTVTSWVFTPIAGGPGVNDMPISFEITINDDGTCVVDQHFAHDPGPRHLEGQVSIGTLFAFTSYVVMLQVPFRMFGFLLMQSQRASASADR